MLAEGKTPCFSPGSAGCVPVRSHVQGWGNAVLGEVIEGKEAVDALGEWRRDRSPAGAAFTRTVRPTDCAALIAQEQTVRTVLVTQGTWK